MHNDFCATRFYNQPFASFIREAKKVPFVRFTSLITHKLSVRSILFWMSGWFNPEIISHDFYYLYPISTFLFLFITITWLLIIKISKLFTFYGTILQQFFYLLQIISHKNSSFLEKWIHHQKFLRQIQFKNNLNKPRNIRTFVPCTTYREKNKKILLYSLLLHPINFENSLMTTRLLNRSHKIERC